MRLLEGKTPVKAGWVMDNITEVCTVNVLCTGTTPKAVFVKSKSGNTACFPLSKITVISGELAKGNEVSLSVPKWLLDEVRQRQTQPAQEIAFTAKVLVTGVLVDRSAKALSVRCDADMVNRWLALSKVEIDGNLPTVPGEAVRVIVPAWMLRHKSGHYPSWVAGAVL